MNFIVFMLFTTLVYDNYCEEFLTTTEENTNCEDNSTCFTTEILNSTENSIDYSTTSASNVTNVTIPSEINNSTEKIINKYASNEICFCDLENSYCDINCCCDEDCLTEQKLIFSSCKTGLSNNYNPKFCYSNDYIYINNTPTTIEVINNELLCVVSTNLPPSYLIQLSQPIETIAQSKKLIAKNYMWSNNHFEEKNDFNISKILKHGDNIFIRSDKSSKLNKLYLPTSFITNVCKRKEEIKFLKFFKSTCSHMINEDINKFLIPETYYDFTFIAFNSTLNYTIFEDISKDCPESICLPINISLCEENFSNCEQVLKNDTRLNHLCQFSLYNNEQTCSQIVKKVKYDIYHNGTEGLFQINLHLNLTNVTFYITNENEQFEQYFEVNFLWHNYKQNFSDLFSGHPGYLIGKPILIANVNCSSYNETSDYIKFDFNINENVISDNFFILPKNVDGYCKLNNESYKFINFGYNMRLSCKKNILLKNNTSNQTCNDIQNNIFRLWEISMENQTSNKYAGVFGNSNRYKIGEWIQIKYNFNINETIEKISFTYNNPNEIICYNLVNKIKINILYANVDLDKALNQKKILSVFLELGTKELSTFTFDDKEKRSLDVKIYSEVMFFDVTAPKLRKFVNPPYLDVKLPRDFFYPFMSAQSNISGNILIICLFIIYFLFV